MEEGKKEREKERKKSFKIRIQRNLSSTLGINKTRYKDDMCVSFLRQKAIICLCSNCSYFRNWVPIYVFILKKQG